MKDTQKPRTKSTECRQERLAFPHDDNAPALLAKQLARIAIPFDISAQFRQLIRLPRLRRASAELAPMLVPEAAMHHDGCANSRNHDVGRTGKPTIVEAIPETHAPDEPSHRQLRARIPPSNGSHYAASDIRRDSIHRNSRPGTATGPTQLVGASLLDQPNPWYTTPQNGAILSTVARSKESGVLSSARRFKFVDLFAGLGGFHVGLASRGIDSECVFACESDQTLRDLYARNFGILPRGDIREVDERDVPRHDICCAGFPCQPFSKAGEQLGTSCSVAGDLFEAHLVRVIAAKRPTFLLLENVPNLERHNNGKTWQTMRRRLEQLGYSIDRRILSPHRFGIPQIRERMFIVGSRNGLNDFEWPAPTNAVPSIYSVLDASPDDAKPISQQYAQCLEVWQEFLDRFPAAEELPSFPIWSMEFGATYPFEHTTPALLSPRALARYRGTHGFELGSVPPSERMSHLPSYAQPTEFPVWKQQFIAQNRNLYHRHERWIRPWLRKLAPFPPSLQKFEWNCKGEKRSVWDTIVQFRASGVRVKRSTTAPALIAMTTTQVPIIASERRYMTPRECSRLQDLGGLKHLPETATKAYRALGNAVNAEIVRLVAKALLSSGGDGRAPRPSRVGGARGHLVRCV